MRNNIHEVARVLRSIPIYVYLYIQLIPACVPTFRQWQTKA